MDRTVPALALCLLLVIAGCGGTDSTTTSTQTTSPTTTGEPGTTSRVDVLVPVNGLDLPVNASRVWLNVRTMLAAPDVTPPSVLVRNVSATQSPFTRTESTFLTRVGLTPPANTSRAGAGTWGRTGASGVTLYVANASQTGLELLLAHEFTHIVQFQSRAVHSLDRGLVRALVLEGAADYTRAMYAQRYTSRSYTFERYQAGYRNISTFYRYQLAPYYFGWRYVRYRVDDPSQLNSVYANPPKTVEQVIHRLPPSAEGAKPLLVGSTTNDSWSLTDVQTRSELLVRFVLETQLSQERAADAAAGWGNDRLMTFYSDNRTGYAWVLRFDDSENLTEFESAVRDFIDREDVPASFSYVRAGNETGVLFVGDSCFTQNATANGTNDDVTVHPGAC